MDSSHLSNLTPELLEQIFLSLDDFQDVSHLAKASRYLNNVYKANARAIFSAVEARYFLHPEGLEDLYLAQGRNDDDRQQARKQENAGDAAKRLKNYMHRCFVNEDVMKRIVSEFQYKHIVNSLQRDGTSQPRNLSSTEIRRFAGAAYDVWILSEVSESHATNLVDRTTLREIVLLREVGHQIERVFVLECDSLRRRLQKEEKIMSLMKIKIANNIIEGQFWMKLASLYMSLGTSLPHLSVPGKPGYLSVLDEGQSTYVAKIPMYFR
ncbi:hypothetical protein MMC13_004058 [Lambiella insularis]|nr:hypothetical protein [Lambiella insularis]